MAYDLVNSSDKNQRDLLSFLTNGTPLQQSDGTVRIIRKNEIDGILRELLRNGDHKAVDELIRMAERTGDEDDDNLKKYSSKSIRVSAPIFAMLNQRASGMKKPISHVVGLMAALHMHAVLAEAAKSGSYDESRVEKLKNLIDQWKDELLRSENLGLEASFIKREKDEYARMLKERLQSAKTEGDRLLVRANIEKALDGLHKRYGDVEDNFEYDDNRGIDSAAKYDNDLYLLLDMPLKTKPDTENLHNYCLPGDTTYNKMVSDLNWWLIEVILRRDLPGISEEGLKKFIEKFVQPVLSQQTDEPYFWIDYLIYPDHSQLGIWKRCDLSAFYFNYTNQIRDTSYGKMVESFAQDYPNDLAIILDRIPRVVNTDRDTSFLMYGLRAYATIDLKTRVSPDMDKLQFNEPIENRQVDIEFNRMGPNLEHHLFPVVLEGLAQALSMPSVEDVKKDMIRQMVSGGLDDENSAEYKKAFDECYAKNSENWPKRKNMLRESSVLWFAEQIVETAFSRRDYRMAKFYNRYTADIRMIMALTQHIAYNVETTKSMVITLTMPKYLQTLWEIGKGDLTANDYVKKLITDYGEQIRV